MTFAKLFDIGDRQLTVLIEECAEAYRVSLRTLIDGVFYTANVDGFPDISIARESIAKIGQAEAEEAMRHFLLIHESTANPD